MKKILLTIMASMVFVFGLSSCDDKIPVAHTTIEITEPVDSKYTQPQKMIFEYNRYDDEEWIGVKYNYNETDEVVNISPQYGGYNVRYYYNNIFFTEAQEERGFIKRNTTTKKMIFPDSMEKIRNYAFLPFKNLEEIVIPKSIYYIDPIAFYKSSIKTITIDEESEFYEVKNDALYQKKEGHFVHYLNNPDLSQYSVYQATDVLDYAFQNTNLTSIVFGEGVKRISGYALDDNANLTSITLPSTFEGFVESYSYATTLAIKDPETEEYIYKDDPRFNDLIAKRIIRIIKGDNPNLKTIYSHANIDYDFTEFGIEYIKL